MDRRRLFPAGFLAATCLLLGPVAGVAESFRVATYNVEGYSHETVPGRAAKSAASCAKVRESIRALRPDVLALQEMGGTNELLELRDSLKADGLDLPFWEHVSARDTNHHLAVLSRFRFTARHSHPDDQFLLGGRRYHVSRGFIKVEIQVNPRYTFTLIAAHLKSKRPSAGADEAELRLEEAKRLREIIDARLALDPAANLVVLGDLNDTRDAPSTKAVVGRGKFKLIDTRPAEPNGDHPTELRPGYEPRSVAWTHFYGRDDTYSRIDYILLSPGMAREWNPAETRVLAIADWGIASDHRPLVVAFDTEDR